MLHKKIKTAYIVILFFATTNRLFSCHQGNITQISIPKCGTNLLLRIISNITKRKKAAWKPGETIPNPAYYSFVPTEDIYDLSNLGPEYFWVTHLPHSLEHEKILHDNNNKIIFIYRDPRDQLISQAHYYLKEKANPTTINRYIIKSITSDEHYGVFTRYKTRLPWMNIPDVCIIRFEDLVGTQRGGCDIKQMAALKKVSYYLDANLSNQELTRIIKEIFGEGHTYRKGIIGDWKNHFTQEHKKLFKKRGGQLLIDLEYEQNMDW